MDFPEDRLTYETFNALIELVNETCGHVMTANKTIDNYLTKYDWSVLILATNRAALRWNVAKGNLATKNTITQNDYLLLLARLQAIKVKKDHVFENKAKQTYSGDSFYAGDNLTMR